MRYSIFLLASVVLRDNIQFLILEAKSYLQGIQIVNNPACGTAVLKYRKIHGPVFEIHHQFPPFIFLSPYQSNHRMLLLFETEYNFLILRFVIVRKHVKLFTWNRQHFTSYASVISPSTSILLCTLSFTLFLISPSSIIYGALKSCSAFMAEFHAKALTIHLIVLGNHHFPVVSLLSCCLKSMNKFLYLFYISCPFGLYSFKCLHSISKLHQVEVCFLSPAILKLHFYVFFKGRMSFDTRIKCVFDFTFENF